MFLGGRPRLPGTFLGTGMGGGDTVRGGSASFMDGGSFLGIFFGATGSFFGAVGSFLGAMGSPFFDEGAFLGATFLGGMGT